MAKTVTTISLPADLKDFADENNISLSHLIVQELKKQQQIVQDRGEYYARYLDEKKKRLFFQENYQKLVHYLDSRDKNILNDFDKTQKEAIAKEAQEEAKEIFSAEVTDKEPETKVEFKEDEDSGEGNE